MSSFPLADQAFDVLWFALPPAGRSETDWEGVGAVVTAEGNAVVCNVPAFVYDVGLGDTVSWIKSEEGSYVATGLVHDAGAWTFRVWLDESIPTTIDMWDVHRSASELGCWVDIVSSQLIALSATAEEAQSVASWLAAAEEAGLLKYETGRTMDKPSPFPLVNTRVTG